MVWPRSRCSCVTVIIFNIQRGNINFHIRLFFVTSSTLFSPVLKKKRGTTLGQTLHFDNLLVVGSGSQHPGSDKFEKYGPWYKFILLQVISDPTFQQSSGGATWRPAPAGRTVASAPGFLLLAIPFIIPELSGNLMTRLGCVTWHETGVSFGKNSTLIS